MDFRNLTQWLDSLLQHGIPASETMISFQGKTVYHHTVGFSDENATHPVTERDISKTRCRTDMLFRQAAASDIFRSY